MENHNINSNFRRGFDVVFAGLYGSLKAAGLVQSLSVFYDR